MFRSLHLRVLPHWQSRLLGLGQEPVLLFEHRFLSDQLHLFVRYARQLFSFF